MKPVPSKVLNCPIREAIVELRFANCLVPPEAIAGIVFRQVQETYPELVPQAMASVPKDVWSEKELIHKPHYHFVGPYGRILIGPRMLAVTCIAPYSGWGEFQVRINAAIDACSEIFRRPMRLGVRYINFFPRDILPETLISVQQPKLPMQTDSTTITLAGKSDPFSYKVVVSNAAKIEEEQGSVIDIDVSCMFDLSAEAINLPTGILDLAHAAEKATFFSLLSDSLLSKLGPEY